MRNGVEQLPEDLIFSEQDRRSLMFSMIATLKAVHEERVDEETPMPDEVALEIAKTLGAEFPNSGNVKEHERWRTVEFPMVGLDGATVRIMVGNNAKIGDGFQAEDKCFVGKKSVIGDNGKISSPIYKSTKVGDNFTLSSNSKVGVEKPKLKDSKKLKKGEKLKDSDKFQVIIGDDVFIDSHVDIMPGTQIGNNTSVGPKTKLGFKPKSAKKKAYDLKTTIGDDCRFDQGVTVEEGVSIADGCNIGEGVVVKTGAIIGDDCFLCKGVVVKPGAKLGKGYIVLPGLKIEKYANIPDNETNELVIISQQWLYKNRIFRSQ